MKLFSTDIRALRGRDRRATLETLATLFALSRLC